MQGFREQQNGIDGRKFYGVKNKEPGSIETRNCLTFGGWLTECMACLVKYSIYWEMKVSFGLCT